MHNRRLRAAWPSAAATALVLFTFTQPGFCDPLHKVGRAGAWQHEQSGWIFPQQVGEFERILPPYEIDGTNDVGAQYERTHNSTRTRATVHVYAKDSAAAEADFDAAKNKSNDGLSESGAQARSQEACRTAAAVPVTCHKVTYASDLKTDTAPSYLYFVETNEWVVNIRTTTEGSTTSAPALIDRFVRELNWKTLGTVPDLHTSR